MIVHLQAEEPTVNRGLTFRDHALAHELLDGKIGIEFGAASHNPFHLVGSVNVAPEEGDAFYKGEQIRMNGQYAKVDFYGEADNVISMFGINSQDYVISSHVLEHLPNPFKAFIEWHGVLRDGGYVFMIVPQRNALEADAGRELTTYAELAEVHDKG
ncbi:MAG: methyltransferase domain-containing protein [Anaerolineae bacterium]